LLTQLIDLPYSEACERNKDVILAVLKEHLSHAKQVLEIGSGTAQHAAHFAAALPYLNWQTSDQSVYLSGVQARVKSTALANLLAPFELDVIQADWLANAPDQTQKYDAVFTANTLHIMSWQNVEAVFSNITSVLSEKALLIIYGPFKYQGQFTSQSNEQFDVMLRQRDPHSGIRDFEQINQLAEAQGFELLQDSVMPANNQCLVWRFSK